MSNMFYVLAVNDIDTTRSLTLAIQRSSKDELLKWLEDLVKDLDELTSRMDSKTMTLEMLNNAMKVSKEIDKEFKLIKAELLNRINLT